MAYQGCAAGLNRIAAIAAVSSVAVQEPTRTAVAARGGRGDQAPVGSIDRVEAVTAPTAVTVEGCVAAGPTVRTVAAVTLPAGPVPTGTQGRAGGVDLERVEAVVGVCGGRKWQHE